MSWHCWSACWGSPVASPARPKTLSGMRVCVPGNTFSARIRPRSSHGEQAMHQCLIMGVSAAVQGTPAVPRGDWSGPAREQRRWGGARFEGHHGRRGRGSQGQVPGPASPDPLPVPLRDHGQRGADWGWRPRPGDCSGPWGVPGEPRRPCLPAAAPLPQRQGRKGTLGPLPPLPRSLETRARAPVINSPQVLEGRQFVTELVYPPAKQRPTKGPDGAYRFPQVRPISTHVAPADGISARLVGEDPGVEDGFSCTRGCTEASPIAHGVSAGSLAQPARGRVFVRPFNTRGTPPGRRLPRSWRAPFVTRTRTGSGSVRNSGIRQASKLSHSAAWVQASDRPLAAHAVQVVKQLRVPTSLPALLGISTGLHDKENLCWWQDFEATTEASLSPGRCSLPPGARAPSLFRSDRRCSRRLCTQSLVISRPFVGCRAGRQASSMAARELHRCLRPGDVGDPRW